ncbi:hypothetical protein ACFS07_23405 [Undibacterium arcticum]
MALEYAAGALKAGVETVFASTRFDDFANKKPLPGYALLNLYSSYDLAQNWSVFGRWNNALNKDYELAKKTTRRPAPTCSSVCVMAIDRS